MSDHLTAIQFFEFIDRGGSSGPVGRHLMDCPDCLFELDFLLLCEAPPAPEEEAVLSAERQSLDFHIEAAGGMFPRKGGQP